MPGDGDIYSVLAEVTKPLRDAHIPYMLVGALAVFVHGAPRMTNDLDIVVDIRGIEVQELKTRLESLGYPTEGPEQTEFGRRIRVWHPYYPTEFFLAGLHPYHEEEFGRAAYHSVGGLEHRVIAPEDLILRKLRNLWIRRSQTDVADLLSVVASQRAKLDLTSLRGRARFFRVLEPLDEVVRLLDEREGGTPPT